MLDSMENKMMQQKDKCTFYYLLGSLKNIAIGSATLDEMLSSIIKIMKRLIESMSTWLWYTQPLPPSLQSRKCNKDHYQVGLSSAQTDDPSNTNLDHARKKQAGARPFPGIWTLHFIGWVARMMTWKCSYLTLGFSALFSSV